MIATLMIEKSKWRRTAWSTCVCVCVGVCVSVSVGPCLRVWALYRLEELLHRLVVRAMRHGCPTLAWDTRLDLSANQ